MEKWVQERLSELLKFPVQHDLVRYIMQIENERDLENYFSSLLDYTDPKHRQFVVELKKQHASYNNQAGYKKTNDNDNVSNKQNDKKKGKIKGRENTQIQEFSKPEARIEKGERKKNKFTSLSSQGNILLKGRHKCDCEAKRHELINNCLNCGRIVCRQENAGPCFFCGELVCSREQQVILQSNTKQADNLYNKLMDRKPSKSLEDSLKQRDKLLEYDRNSTPRTKVIDDEADYYQSSNVWLSAEERDKLQKQEAEAHARKHMSRLDKRVAIDFMGRVVEEEDQSNDPYNDLQLEEFDKAMSHDNLKNQNVCPTIEFDYPMFVETKGSAKCSIDRNQTWTTQNRIQDREYLEMSDQGVCLSMHQPYASLLVAGIKIHEGRSWYSMHRGRLWIASTAKIPSTEEISEMQHFYHVLKSETIKFPETYPTSCLLGCVTITDVLPQEEYKKLYPEGESDAPYVFICENFYTLPLYFPIRGKHKIYKMEKKLHQAACKYLGKSMKIDDQ